MRDQFRQSNRLEQTGCDAPGKGLAKTGQHRHTGPQGIASCCLGVIRQGIQKNVGKPIACQMVFKPLGPVGEYQARRINAARRGLTALIVHSHRVGFLQPQHTVFSFA